MNSIPSWAVRGAKVVCVRTIDTCAYPEVPYPTVGATYTVARVGHGDEDGDAIITVDEIDSRDGEGFDVGYSLACFRPAVEPKSEVEDVALFKHHLDQRQPVDA